MLEIRNLVAGYLSDVPIVENINFTVGDNEVIVVVGQNGSGKSTIAKSILGMTPFRKGSIHFNGKDISSIPASGITREGIGFFMQGGRVFNHLTIEENLRFAAGNLNRGDYTARYREIAKSFAVIADANPKASGGALSGGERHQLALAMILMQRPTMLILDEPSAGLSPANVKRLYDILQQLKQNEVKSIMIIEQNVAAGVQFGDRVLLLQNKTIIREEFCYTLDSLTKIDEFFFGKFN